MAAKWEYVGAKIPKELLEEFEKKAGKKNKSVILRELIKKFNRGEVKVTLIQTFGG